jgi:hypothetical protein
MHRAELLIKLCVSLIFCLFLTGCVKRTVLIDSQPQGAAVYFDYQKKGTTPCSFDFIFYGDHHLELVKEDFENLNTTVSLKAPFYEYIPLDFFVENLWPFQLEDRHSFSFKLTRGKSAPVIYTIAPKINAEGQEEKELMAPKLEKIEAPDIDLD